MGATFAKLKTQATGGTIEAGDWNAEFDNLLNNLTPGGMDDESVNAAAMQATADPFPGGVASLATSLQGEIQRLRYAIKQMHQGAYWYSYPAFQVRDKYRNLVITNGSDADHDVDVDADEIILEDTNNIPKRVASVNLTIATDTVGANGMDAAIDAGWNYVWVINNGTTTAGLISASATAPTLPSGYTFKALVGAVSAGAHPDHHISKLYQKDHRVSAPQTAAVTNGGSGTYAEIDLAAIVPVTAKAAKGIYASLGAGGAIYIAPAGSATTGYGEWAATASGATLSAGFLVDIYTPQKLYYYVVTANTNIFITGWEY